MLSINQKVLQLAKEARLNEVDSENVKRTGNERHIVKSL